MTTDHVDNELSVDLTTRWQTWGDEGLPTDFASRLQAMGVFEQESLACLVQLGEELETRLEARSPRSAVDHFIAASDGWTDYLDRMATVRTLEYLEQPRMKPVSWLRRTSPEANARRRTLTGIETGLVRYCSLSSWRRSGPVGALDSGVASGELGVLTSDGVLLNDCGIATHLDCAGTRHANTFGYPSATPRTATIADWARGTFTELVARADSTRPVLYGGNSKDPAKIQSLILMNVGKVMQLAGLANDPTVTPLSIRNTAARRVYDAHGLEAAAGLLGHDDFSGVAREIGIRPHGAPRKK